MALPPESVERLDPSGPGDVSLQLRELRELLHVVAAGADLHATLDRIARWVERVSPGTLCSLLLLDAQRGHVITAAAPSLPGEFNRSIDGLEIGPRHGSCGTAAFTGKPVIVTDIASDPLWEDYRDLALPFGLRACWSHPITGSDGLVLGTFAVYRQAPAAPADDEWQLVIDAVRVAALVVERARADQRRAEHERELHDILDRAPDAVARADLEGRVLFANAAAARLAGRHAEAMIGRRPPSWASTPSPATDCAPCCSRAPLPAACIAWRRASTAEGEERWLDAVLIPEREGGNGVALGPRLRTRHHRPAPDGGRAPRQGGAAAHDLRRHRPPDGAPRHLRAVRGRE